MTNAGTERQPPPERGPDDVPEKGHAEAVEDPGLSTLEQPDAPGFEPNRLLRWLYTRFFRHMRID